MCPFQIFRLSPIHHAISPLVRARIGRDLYWVHVGVVENELRTRARKKTINKLSSKEKVRERERDVAQGGIYLVIGALKIPRGGRGAKRREKSTRVAARDRKINRFRSSGIGDTLSCAWLFALAHCCCRNPVRKSIFVSLQWKRCTVILFLIISILLIEIILIYVYSWSRLY